MASDDLHARSDHALIEHVYRHARQFGASRVHWLTQHTNTQAMQLYDRIADRSGFIQYRKFLPSA
jgi:ribosomal protein S18 acetylase RimI-like enzyme